MNWAGTGENNDRETWNIWAPQVTLWMSIMQHSEIERDCLIDRYVRNTLRAAERQAFEEHFLDCPQCLGQIEIASSLRQALRESAVEAVSQSAPAPAKPRRWFVWNWVQAGAAACLVVAMVTSIVFFRQMRDARSELASAQSAFLRELGSVRGLPSPPEVYVLGQSRGSSEVKEIRLPHEARWMVFSIEMDTTQYPNYRATLSDDSGKTIWQRDGIHPASPDAIVVSVPSYLLTPGVYSLTIATSGQSTLTRISLRFK
jgi:hypothetical protein